MADYNSSLPIRTEAAGDVSIKVVDSTITSQGMTVNADGSLDINVISNDVDIRDLTHVSDSVKVGDGTDLLEVNADGSINITDNGGSITVDAVNLDVRDLTHASDSVKIGDGTDLLAVNADGSINVVVTDSSGTEVNDYDAASAVAGGATDTHTYTAVGSFTLTQILASASGKCKIEVRVNGVTKYVMFNSTANPNMELIIKSPLTIATTETIEIIRTNKENQAQDLYSTIIGVEN